jgi:Response regulator of the LytR/AlgR family
MTSFVPKAELSELLEQAVNQALDELLEERENLEVFSLVNDESNKSTIKISSKDIVYFSSQSKNVTLHSNLDGQSFSLGRRSLDDLEKRYSTHLFVRIDRPTLINVTFVTSFTDNSVTLQYGRNNNSMKEVTLHMSFRRKEAFRDVYWPWIHGK